MTSVACTLFENHYHFGVASLINSLYKNGYKGDFFVGYRGKLPNWASTDRKSQYHWQGATCLRVKEDLTIHFLPIENTLHLSNFKPLFMLEIIKILDEKVYSIAYFDPDIVIKTRWDFFDRWIKGGVAVVHEIISNDMPPNHPIRKEWEKVLIICNRSKKRELTSYINAGFCGVSRENIEFLKIWCEIINVAITKYNFDSTKFFGNDRTHPFYASDQDAMNITAMCCDCSLSEIGPEGMDFIHGGFTMSHAVGKDKPWKKNYLLHALKGKPPSLADKAYWSNVNGLINNYKSYKYLYKKFSLMSSAFIGRFYKSN